MAEPRTAGEWAAFCRNKFMASTDPLPGHIPVGLCLDCARAYAKSCVVLALSAAMDPDVIRAQLTP